MHNLNLGLGGSLLYVPIILFFLAGYQNTLHAQAPDGFTYQAVIRDAEGALLANSPVGLRFNILAACNESNIEYQEIHTTTTDENGVATVVIGEGAQTAGDFSAIDWSAADFCLKEEIDPAGSSGNYTLSATTPLKSVPFSYFSSTSAQAMVAEEANTLEADYLSRLLPIGMVTPFAGSSAPDGWLLCDGSALQQSEYPDLYAVIGNSYGGSGNTFNLPDLRGRAPFGYHAQQDTFSTLGSTGGTVEHTLTVEEMPEHMHTGETDNDGEHEHRGNNVAQVEDGTGSFVTDDHENNNPGSIIHSQNSAHQHNFTTDPTGGNEPHPNMPPFQVLNYIIKARY
ncbi:MAG: phage tail protein [Phaeodactylibacter xiamenensis]|uniref:phage tail protein n=1 Tax=Phaeodactylibacter xiamenensis TaxID=1524460 RepID=UPI00069693D1|nr:tail fiber protein [Phaeodactylibacter xiamenensis]